MMLSRRQFVARHGLTAVAAAGCVIAPATVVLSSDRQQDDKKKSGKADGKKKKARERKPRIELEMVQEMVAVAHSKLDRVKELYESEPRLVNATHDWGAGDFETALGAASHTGQREIALFLLEKGARMDIFAATMLGRLDIVKATLTAFPAMIDTPGPHGIPLIKHAEYGKEPAAEVLKYLQALKES